MGAGASVGLASLASVSTAEGVASFGGLAFRLAPQSTGLGEILLFEVTAGDPEAIEAVAPVLGQLLGTLGRYLSRQMAAGRLRSMHPLLAAQLLIGPVFFHLMTRPVAIRVAHLDVELEAAVTALAEAAVRGLAPVAQEERE